jgi:hypothetical protein
MLKHSGVGTRKYSSTENILNNGYLWHFCQGAIDLRRGLGGEGIVLRLKY